MRGKVRTKAFQIKSWIYNGENGPEVYELDERGRLKDETNGRRTRPSDVPKPPLPALPPLFSIDTRIQTFPHTPSSSFSSIGELDTSPVQTKSNHTQSVDFPAISEWFTELESNSSSQMMELESEDFNFFLHSDLDFEFSYFDSNNI
jgi:hypothetical protein